jgi:hypothetical protein
MESRLKLSCFLYKNVGQYQVTLLTTRVTHSTEILSFPLLDRSLRLEIAQVFETQSLIPVTQFCCPLFTPLNDRIDVVVDHETRTPSVIPTTKAERNPLIVRVDDLLGTMSDHFQQLILVRGYSNWVNVRLCEKRRWFHLSMPAADLAG